MVCEKNVVHFFLILETTNRLKDSCTTSSAIIPRCPNVIPIPPIQPYIQLGGAVGVLNRI